MTAPTRLLLTADTVGGVWRYTIELARALAPLGYESVIATLGPPAEAAQRAEVADIAGARLINTGLPLDWVAEEESEVRRAGRGIAALAEEVAADLVQLNQPALAAEPMPAPTVAVLHSCVATWWAAMREGPMPDAFEWRTALVHQGLVAADRIVCPSAAFAEAARATYRLRAAPAVVHNGRTGAPRRTAGRLWDEGKDIATLDRAAARLGAPVKAAGPLAGPNGQAVRLEHAHAMGRLDEPALAACLAARPVFASAARYEPFGLAVLEAAQAGCPLVLADIPTFRELWGEVAAFVAPGDDAGFADAIEALLGDTVARLALGERARTHAARYTPQAMAHGMERLYRPLLASEEGRDRKSAAA